MPKRIDLTTEQKWGRVDQIINTIDRRKAQGQEPCVSYIETYINETFNSVLGDAGKAKA
jgi:hypothetical protein